MSRLTKHVRFKDDKDGTSTAVAMNVPYFDFVNQAIEKLAHYEDLEEAGRLIELPCKVDELVWVVKNEEVVPHWVDSFYVAECVTVNLTDLEERDVEVALEDFGKTVILAKDGAEADQKLAELKEGAE